MRYQGIIAEVVKWMWYSMMKRWKVPQPLLAGFSYDGSYDRRVYVYMANMVEETVERKEKRKETARHLCRVKQSVPKEATFGLYDANVFYWSRSDKLVNQQQPFVFRIMNELCHRTHRFAIVRHSQIVPATLFKMLKTRPASDKRRIHIGWRIYASGSRHKSSEGNEKRRAVSRHRDIRLRIEMVAGVADVSPSSLNAITSLRYRTNHS